MKNHIFLFPLAAAIVTGSHSVQAQSTAAKGGGAPAWFTETRGPRTVSGIPEGTAVYPGQNAMRMAAPFEHFKPKVRYHWDGTWFYEESDGMPDTTVMPNIMVGITSWQQQVPLPQSYFGNNAWRIPLIPIPSKNPLSIHNRFLRGAIAIAANGIPIFNPQNNRGEISKEIGELDQWGGHCGRADDYHYHAAPLHLQKILGISLPIAYALDGYPIYGLTEPDGSAPAVLDSFNGHESSALGYHYHASNSYPYINGGFHGEVVERDGQVDPQPRAQPVREALRAWPGAKITGFTVQGSNHFSLKFVATGQTHFVNYAVQDNGVVKFDFIDGNGAVRSDSYSARTRNPPGGNQRPSQGPSGPQAAPQRPESGRSRAGQRPAEEAAQDAVAPMDYPARHSGQFVLTSASVTNGGALPAEFSGDGKGSTLPLTWNGVPAGTKSYALIMDHLAPGNVMKCYWTLWDIPPETRQLPKNAQGIGKTGSSFKGKQGYEPPHSQGPGPKIYTLRLYALSAAPTLMPPAREVTREILLHTIKDMILDTAELKVVYTRPGSGESPDAPTGQGGARKGESRP